MTIIRPGRSTESGQAAAAQVEGELSELIRRDVAPLRRPQLVEGGGEATVTHVTTLIDRVSGTSVSEIEKLIFELQALKDFLQTEGQRVQREIAGYAQLSHSAMKSTKIMAESVAQWKTSVQSARPAERV